MPSVASQVSASQLSRVHHSEARSRTDGSDRGHNSPFSELLDNTAPSAEPPPAPRSARADRADRNDAPRSTDKGRKTDAPTDRNTPNDTRDASDASNSTNAKDTKSADGDATAQDAKASDDATKAADSDKDTTTADKAPDAETKADAALVAALQAERTQPVIVAPQPVATDTPATDETAASGAAPQIDALIALQAAEQEATAGEARPAAKGDGSDELKTDAKDKKEIKADAKGDAKALTETKAEATADAKTSAAQPQSGQGDDAERQEGGKAGHDVRHSAAKPAGENPKSETRVHQVADTASISRAGAAVTTASADAAAAAAQASNTAPSASTTPAQTPTLTPAHIQAQLQAQAQANAPAAVPLSGVAVEIATQASAGKQHFEIRLDPAELGRIDVKLDIDSDGNTTTRLFVERSDTLELLKRDASQLERALQQAGLKTSDHAMEFSLRQQFAQNDDQGASNTAKIVVPDDEAALFPVQRQNYGRLLGSGGGLDIRV